MEATQLWQSKAQVLIEKEGKLIGDRKELEREVDDFHYKILDEKRSEERQKKELTDIESKLQQIELESASVKFAVVPEIAKEDMPVLEELECQIKEKGILLAECFVKIEAIDNQIEKKKEELRRKIAQAKAREQKQLYATQQAAMLVGEEKQAAEQQEKARIAVEVAKQDELAKVSAEQQEQEKIAAAEEARQKKLAEEQQAARINDEREKQAAQERARITEEAKRAELVRVKAQQEEKVRQEQEEARIAVEAAKQNELARIRVEQQEQEKIAAAEQAAQRAKNEQEEKVRRQQEEVKRAESARRVTSIGVKPGLDSSDGSSDQSVDPSVHEPIAAHSQRAQQPVTTWYDVNPYLPAMPKAVGITLFSAHVAVANYSTHYRSLLNMGVSPVQQIVSLLYKGGDAVCNVITGSTLSSMPGMKIPDWFLQQKPAVQVAATLAVGSLLYGGFMKLEQEASKREYLTAQLWTKRMKQVMPALTLATATRFGLVPKEYQNITTGLIVAGTVVHQMHRAITNR